MLGYCMLPGTWKNGNHQFAGFHGAATKGDSQCRNGGWKKADGSQLVEFHAKHQANQGDEPSDHASQDQRSPAPLVDSIDAEDRGDYAWNCGEHSHCTC